MTYFIYVKRPDTNIYVNCYLEDCFTDESKALERAEFLNRTSDIGYNYIVVKLGCSC